MKRSPSNHQFSGANLLVAGRATILLMNLDCGDRSVVGEKCSKMVGNLKDTPPKNKHDNGTSPFSIGNRSSNGWFSIVMLVFVGVFPKMVVILMVMNSLPMGSESASERCCKYSSTGLEEQYHLESRAQNIYKWKWQRIFSLDDGPQSLIWKMGGIHHFHPYETGCLGFHSRT